jgi:hypothetical protein
MVSACLDDIWREKAKVTRRPAALISFFSGLIGEGDMEDGFALLFSKETLIN